MASESKLENVMLTGQNAYFKKNGSMKNHGTIELENALSAHSYDEGYIGPNSILHGTDLAETNEYTQCEFMMKTFLEDAWEEKEGERTIITNGNNIKTALLPGETYMRQLYDNITFDGTELQYIRSSGTQYINTKYKPNGNTSIDMEMKSLGSTGILFGAYNNDWTNGFGIYAHYNDNDKHYRHYADNVKTNTNANDMHIQCNKGVTIINDVTQANSAIKTFNVNYNMYIFGGNWSGGTKDITTYSLYKFKIYDDNVLVRDFIPCKDPDGIVCLYDKVSKQYFYNSGTGTFTAGPEANPDNTHTELEYIESTGNQYINLGIKADETSGFSIDFMPMEDFESASSSGDKYIIAAGGNGSGIGIRAYPYINICSKPDYPKGSIQVGRDSTPLNADLVQYERTKIELKNNELTLKNGTKVTTEQGVPSNYPNWRLFNFYAMLGTVSAYSKARLYSCKIYEGDTVVMDLVPAKDKHNIGCVYDKISEKLIYPNSKTLKLGPVKNI